MARLHSDGPKRLRRPQVETHLPEGSTGADLEKPSGSELSYYLSRKIASLSEFKGHSMNKTFNHFGFITVFEYKMLYTPHNQIPQGLTPT